MAHRYHRYLEVAAATAVASVAATMLVTAQAQTASARPEDGRAVTAVGCLKQERDIHGRMTTGSESGKPGDGFVLLNARITGASRPEAPITASPATADPATPGAAAAERQRRTEPSGAPGAGGAGTSGTGSTSVQTTERPANQASQAPTGAATASNPAPARGSETMYKVVGLSDAELTPLLGKEVEVRARLDANTMGSAALRQPAATMGREPASTPSASTPPPSPTQAPATAAADRQDTTPPAATLPELKATAIKATGGRCQGT
jgi:hypothetical protein